MSERGRTSRSPGRASGGSGRAVLHAVVTVLVLAVGALVVNVLAALVSGSTGSVAFYVVLRTLLTALLVLVVVRWRAGSAHRRGLPSAPWVGAPALLAYLLTPGTWDGLTLFTQGLLGVPLSPGGVVVAVVVDGVVWAGLVAAALRWSARREPLREASPTPYG